MNKKYTLLMGFMLSVSVFANMVYDPINHCIYSLPLSPEINQMEYWGLLNNLKVLNARITQFHGGWVPDKEVESQICHYLKSVGTPTALRLMADLKKECMYYPDGSKCSI